MVETVIPRNGNVSVVFVWRTVDDLSVGECEKIVATVVELSKDKSWLSVFQDKGYVAIIPKDSISRDELFIFGTEHSMSLKKVITERLIGLKPDPHLVSLKGAIKNNTVIARTQEYAGLIKMVLEKMQEQTKKFEIETYK